MALPPLTADLKFKITLGVFLSALSLAAGFGWKAQATLSSLNNQAKEANDKFDGLGQKIQQIETSMTQRLTAFEVTMSDRFTKTAAAEWALRLVVSNPNLRIPDPRDPSRMLSASAPETSSPWSETRTVSK